MPISSPVGVVVAGGRGRRLGGDKALVELAGRPLVHYPLDALHEVCTDVAVVAKARTRLPPLPAGVEIWIEPDEPTHPLAGVAYALRRAAGRAVLAVAVDLPLVDATTLRELLHADPGGRAAVVPRVDGRLQPVCALYLPQALSGLQDLAAGASAIAIVEALGIREVQPSDPVALHNVNGPEDVAEAAALLRTRREKDDSIRPASF